MSVMLTAGLWLVLAVVVAVGVLVAIGVGTLYGRLAHRLDDETAARGANVVAIGLAAVSGVTAWVVADAGAAAGSRLLEGIAADIGSAVVGGLAAGLGGAGAITGVVRGYPALPGVDDPRSVRRRYLRYAATIFTIAFLLVVFAEPALAAGTLATVGFLLVALLGLWVAAPILRTMTMRVRSPTDAERRRIEPLLAELEFEPRRVRVVEGGDRYVAVELLGPPSRRVLFVGAEALSSFDDATLRGVFAARREQATHHESLATLLAFVAAVAPVLAVVAGDLTALVGAGLAVGIALVGFALTRRLRYYTDARAAARVGPAELAAAFERAAEAADIDIDLELDLEGGSNRRVLATKPSLASRVARLRERSSGSEPATKTDDHRYSER